MLSVQSNPMYSLSHPSVMGSFTSLHNDFQTLEDALQPFVSLVTNELGGTGQALKLSVSLPDWEEWSKGTTLDIHDFHKIHTRLIVFLHSLVNDLRAAKILASYHLCPCHNDSSFVLVRAVPVPVNQASCGLPRAKDQFTEDQRFKIFIKTIEGIPTLIMS